MSEISCMKPIRAAVQTEFDGHDHILCCPRCGDTYLHHCRVSVFSRRHEDGPVTEICVLESGLADVKSAGDRNPSSRRDGLAIGFWCEGCGADDLELTIAQHKGNTFLKWRRGPAAPESSRRRP